MDNKNPSKTREGGIDLSIKYSNIFRSKKQHMDDLSNLKRHLKELIQQTTKPSKNGFYNCPFCGSGTHEHGTGAIKYNPSTDTFKCFACGKYGDIFTYYQELYKVDFKTAKERLETLFNERPINTYKNPHNTTAPTYQNQPTQFNNFNSIRTAQKPAEKTIYKSFKQREKERIKERENYLKEKARKGGKTMDNTLRRYNNTTTEDIEAVKRILNNYINLFYEDGNPIGNEEVTKHLYDFSKNLNKEHWGHFEEVLEGAYDNGVTNSLIFLRQLNEGVFLKGQKGLLAIEDGFYIHRNQKKINKVLKIVENFREGKINREDPPISPYDLNNFIFLMDNEEIDRLEKFLRDLKTAYMETLNKLFFKNEENIKKEIGDPSSYGKHHPLLIDIYLRDITTAKGAERDNEATTLTDNNKYKSTIAATVTATTTTTEGTIVKAIEIVLTIKDKSTDTDTKYKFNFIDYGEEYESINTEERKKIYIQLRKLINETVYLSEEEIKELSCKPFDEDNLETIKDFQLSNFGEYPTDLENQDTRDLYVYRSDIRRENNRLNRILKDPQEIYLSPKNILKAQYKINSFSSEIERIETIIGNRENSTPTQPTAQPTAQKIIWSDDIQEVK